MIDLEKKRKAFKSYANTLGFDVSEVNTPLGISFKRLSTANAFKVWLASSNHVYEGFKLVPVEPTKEMYSAGTHELTQIDFSDDY